ALRWCDRSAGWRRRQSHARRRAGLGPAAPGDANALGWGGWSRGLACGSLPANDGSPPLSNGGEPLPRSGTCAEYKRKHTSVTITKKTCLALALFRNVWRSCVAPDESNYSQIPE